MHAPIHKIHKITILICNPNNKPFNLHYSTLNLSAYEMNKVFPALEMMEQSKIETNCRGHSWNLGMILDSPTLLTILYTNILLVHFPCKAGLKVDFL